MGNIRMRGHCMKKIKILISCIFLLLLASCSIAPSENSISNDESTTSESDVVSETWKQNEALVDTNTVTINGVVYRNRFQGDLILREPKYGSESVFENEFGRFFRIVDKSDYDLIYNENSDVIGAPESIYCRDDQWRELNTYYSDTNNFTYQCIAKQKGKEFKTYIINEMDIVKLNELVDFCEKNSYDPFSFSNSKNIRTVSTSSLGDTEYRFGMNSNDGLFSSGAASFFILDDKLVLEYYSLMSEEKTLIVDLPEELNQYFTTIINSSNIN